MDFITVHVHVHVAHNPEETSKQGCLLPRITFEFYSPVNYCGLLQPLSACKFYIVVAVRGQGGQFTIHVHPHRI